MTLQFENELKNVLTELRIAARLEKEAKSKKDVLREQIKNWMKMNNLKNHVIQDTNGDNWKIQISDTERRKIKNWAILKEVLGTTFEQHVTFTSSERFITECLNK